ncbi:MULTISPECIES: DUF4232 domain-containing protein [Streptomyces]|uniref:DUF4232 domain-containing protein n=1 Tax=Streptomyces cacaoi TaxID=1898 RepID=A0A4Y3R4W7_STRCI|nr:MULTISPECIES: DUF4232 domain-containing protein [Streptomyces]NNG84301.1 DUF4232 domain-containing protein [Streptomyces cacaoi]QHF96391.1 DUF4232 domain-containing protein [Streptomyces sp. NHF165]GEB52349.1 hypothetical protein SCA03_49000 [Streptomyces cacaoi]
MTEQYRSSTGIRGRLARRIGGAGLAAVAVAGLGLAGAGAAEAASSSATPTCTASGLDASFGKRLAGGMNHQGVVLKVKNTSGHTCYLRGYPGLGLENDQHRTLASSTHWGNTWYAKDPGKKTLALKNGQSAEAVVSWTHANTGTSDAKHASYLQVTPPASTEHKTLKFPNWVDNGRLAVTAFAPSVPLNG